jgi:hypothetical protein
MAGTAQRAVRGEREASAGRRSGGGGRYWLSCLLPDAPRLALVRLPRGHPSLSLPRLAKDGAIACKEGSSRNSLILDFVVSTSLHMTEPDLPLLVTWSFNETGNPSPGNLVKNQASSLMRSFFSGRISIFKNYQTPLFKIDRRNVDEEMVSLPIIGKSEEAMSNATTAFLFQLPKHLKPDGRQWVIVSDPAGVALRNIDHLIPADASRSFGPTSVDLYWTKITQAPDKSGKALATPGFWAVRLEHLELVLQRWQTVRAKTLGSSDEEVWTRTLEELPLTKRPFEKGEVVAPAMNRLDWEEAGNAAFVTVAGWPRKEARRFLEALYFGTYLGDDTGMILNILEA